MKTLQHPTRRLCLAVDIEAYSRLGRTSQLEAQDKLLWIMAQSCRVARVSEANCTRRDTGDGQILILPAGLDEGAVLPEFLNGLRNALHQVNLLQGSNERIRLRISVGQGTIYLGANGIVGATILTVARLLDSPQLRKALLEHDMAEAALIVTTDLYYDIFSLGASSLPTAGFHQVHVTIKDFQANAWLQILETPENSAALPLYPGDDWLGEGRGRRRQWVSDGLLDLPTAAAIAWAQLGAGTSVGNGEYTDVKAEALDVVTEVLHWQLADGQWERIERFLANLQLAQERGDVPALIQAVAELEVAGPVRITRIGATPAIPPPLIIRERVNQLISSLRSTAESREESGER